MMWTPYEMEIILHHNCSAAAFPRADASAYANTVAQLVHGGILQSVRSDGKFITTERGKALVEMWCKTPLPVARFVDPRFEKGAAA